MRRRIHWAVTAACLTLAAPVDGQQPAAEQGEGRAVFEMVCAMCHSVQPPPKAAPPMSHAAAYYAQRFADADSAAAAIVEYLKVPSAEKSLLPAHAIERFGLMPSQAHLSDAQLRAVARYVLTLADSMHGRGGMHRGHD